MAETTNHKHDESNPAVSHERRDVNVFQITAFGIGLLIGCIIVVFAMWAMFDFLAHREDKMNPVLPESMRKHQMLPPEPRLQATPKIELKDLRESEDVILSGYGVLDPGKGVARIPIERAIDIVAAKGFASKPVNDGYRTIPLDSNGGRTLEKISQ